METLISKFPLVKSPTLNLLLHVCHVKPLHKLAPDLWKKGHTLDRMMTLFPVALFNILYTGDWILNLRCTPINILTASKMPTIASPSLHSVNQRLYLHKFELYYQLETAKKKKNDSITRR